jgi:hypothetical protein
MTRRCRAITTNVTEEEYALFEARKGGTTVSEWAHDVLVRTATAPAEGPVILAELLAVRALLLNLLYKMSNGTLLTPDEMQRLIDRADADKAAKAQARLAGPKPD